MKGNNTPTAAQQLPPSLPPDQGPGLTLRGQRFSVEAAYRGLDLLEASGIQPLRFSSAFLGSACWQEVAWRFVKIGTEPDVEGALGHYDALCALVEEAQAEPPPPNDPRRVTMSGATYLLVFRGEQ